MYGKGGWGGGGLCVCACVCVCVCVLHYRFTLAPRFDLDSYIHLNGYTNVHISECICVCVYIHICTASETIRRIHMCVNTHGVALVSRID